MAVDETSFSATRCSICPSSLPVNTPPKAIGWRHLDGTLRLVLTTVSSKMRVQVKQGEKLLINMQLNKLTPAQKKVVTAPRIQYLDSRMSFRYPSSFQVDNGMSERFQLLLDNQSSVLAAIKKLTPFFNMISPAAPIPPLPTAGPSTEKHVNKKRKVGDDVLESQVTPTPASKKKKKETALAPSPPSPPAVAYPEESPTGSSSASGSAGVHSQAVRSAEGTQSSTPSVPPIGQHVQRESILATQTDNPAPDLADPTIEALKAQLLRGTHTPEATQQHDISPSIPPRQKPHPELRSDSFLPPSTGDISHTIPSRTSSSAIQPTIPAAERPDDTTSIDRVELEIDLMPRSPLVDTATPPSSLAAQTTTRSLGAFTSLIGLDFRLDETEADKLNCAFPPMRTRAEEEAERWRKKRDEEEWEEGGVGIESDVSAELRSIWQNHDQTVDLATINSLASRASITDDEIFDLLDRGQLDMNFLEMCYRVATAACQQPPNTAPHEMFTIDAPLRSSPPAESSYEIARVSHAALTPRPVSWADQPSQLPITYHYFPAVASSGTFPQHELYQTHNPRQDDSYTPRYDPPPQDRPVHDFTLSDQDPREWYHGQGRYRQDQDYSRPPTMTDQDAHYHDGIHTQHQRYDDFNDIDD